MFLAPRQSGFTLLELVVAIAIFAVLAALAYGGLANTLDAREQITAHQDRLAVIETAFALLEADVANAVPRSVRDELGGILPAVSAPPDSQAFELTRYVDDSFSSVPQTRLRRVGYALEEGRLLRNTWPVLDRTPGQEPARRVLLDNVQAVSFRFHDGRWVDYWPQATGNVAVDDLPRGVEVSVEFSNGLEARRILLVEARL